MNRKEPKKVIHVRMPASEADRIRALAESGGIQLSEFIRLALKGTTKLTITT